MAKTNTKELLEQILAEVVSQGNRIGTLEQEIAGMKKANAKSAPKASKTKETKGKANGKSSRKTTANAKAEQPKTKAEAIEQWKSARYSEEERAEFGKAAKEVREEMMAENKKMVKTVKGKKVYDDNYYAGAKWTREFNKRMKERGFKVGK
jgi:hypothetical protein